MSSIQRLGIGTTLLEHFLCPVGQQHLLAVAHQLQARLAVCSSQMLVVLEVGNFLGRVVGAVAVQAVQQEDVDRMVAGAMPTVS